MDMDQFNNTYVAGIFHKNSDLNPFIDTFFVNGGLPPENGSGASFIQKIDSNCDVIWTYYLRPSNLNLNTPFTRIKSIQVGPTGNIYLYGIFNGSNNVNLNGSNFNINTPSYYPINFILKLTNNGELLWYKENEYQTFTTNAPVTYLDSKVNSQDELIICIKTNLPSIDIDPGPGIVNVNTAANEQLITYKLDTSGQVVWWNQLANPNGNFSFVKLNMAANDSIYVGLELVWNGFSTSSDQSIFSQNNLGELDTFNTGGVNTNVKHAVYKISPSGNTESFITLGIGWLQNLWLDNSQNIYYVRMLSTPISFDSNGVQIVIAPNYPNNQSILIKLNTNGDYLWSKKFYESTYQGAHSFNVASFDSKNSITLGGTFYHDTIILNTSPTVYYTNQTSGNSYLLKLDSSGNYLWSKQLDGQGLEYLTSIQYDNEDLLTVAGFFLPNIILDVSDSSYNLVSESGSFDGFLVKLKTCTTDSLITNIETCGEPYFWNKDSTLHTQSGQFIRFKTNSNRCDSVFLLNLTINTTYNNTYAVTTCDGSYYWPANNTTYTEDGVYTASLLSQSGCDSIITLDLTVKSRTFNTESVSTCEAYTWPINGRTYYESGNFIDTTVNTQGCDSINSLILTILKTEDNSSITACNSFINPITNALEMNSGVYSDTFINSYGCDSIITLNFTINSVSETAISQAQNAIVSANDNASFQWLKCDSALTAIENENSKSFIPTESGQYAVQLTENGCVDTSACLTVEVIDTSDPEISIYPNPNNGKFTVDLDNAQGATISLYDSRGALVIYRTGKSGIQTFDLEHASGMYNLVVQFGDKLFAKRLIIAF